MAGNIIPINLNNMQVQPRLFSVQPVKLPDIPLSEPLLKISKDNIINIDTDSQIFSEDFSLKSKKLSIKDVKEKEVSEKRKDIIAQAKISALDIIQYMTPIAQNFLSAIPATATSEAAAIATSSLTENAGLFSWILSKFEKIDEGNLTFDEKLEKIKAKLKHKTAVPELILNEINENNIDVVNIIVSDKEFFHDDNVLETIKIIKSINEGNKDFAKWLLTEYKNKNYSPFATSFLIKVANENNKDLAKYLLSERKQLSINTIYEIIENTKKSNKNLVMWMCQNEEFINSKNNHEFTGIIKSSARKNSDFAEWMLKNTKFKEAKYWRFFSGILWQVNEKNKDFAKWLCKNENFLKEENTEYISAILSEINDVNQIVSKELIEKNNTIPIKHLEACCFLAKRLNIKDTDIIENIYNKYLSYKEKILKNPELYINGEFSSQEKVINEINSYCEFYLKSMLLLNAIFDKETVDNLFRRRFDDLSSYLKKLEFWLGPEQLQLLQKIINCNNIDDKPLLPSQKAECIDLITAYSDSTIDSIIENEIVDNKIDLNKIKFKLFKEILKDCGMTEMQLESIPKEKLMAWNLSYMHLLPKSMKFNKKGFADLLNAANLDNFQEYIHDKNNDYGKVNYVTAKKFKEFNMDYNKWIKPDKIFETSFVSNDENSEMLLQLSKSLSEDINILRNSPVKGFFDKQFSKYIQNEKFVIPREITTSKANLSEFIKNIVEQLEPVWKRAENNKDNPQKQKIARETLTILSHLKTKLISLKNMNSDFSEKSYDLSIKMWDRNPQKDLFQGNFSTCCIGMGEENAGAMSVYLTNSAYNMIELVDNNTGKIIGNALCYFVQNKNGKPIFVIDNIEINNAKKPSTKVGIQLREKIFEYAENIAKSVTGRKTDVIISGSYNDVELDELKCQNEYLKLIGEINSEDIYMDLFNGWINPRNFEKTNFYKQ